jgi:6,7-dimethyl-8-ribityllumazine synthase
MTGSLKISSTFDASARRVVIVAARFNAALVDQLVAGASAAWRAHGGSESRLFVEHVPGAFELPLAAKMFAASGRVDAVIALGCVIRGDTPHFDFVAGECARGLMEAGLATGVPVIFGVLTTETQAQAEERADVARMNKGRESMEAALEMIQLLAPPAAPTRKPERARQTKPVRTTKSARTTKKVRR